VFAQLRGFFFRAVAARGIAVSLLFSLAATLTHAAEPARPFGEVIDSYVRESFVSNLSLQSESLEVERNLALLDAAHARFLPAVSLAVRYSRAEGGREFDVPFGSTLNSVYTTLND